MDWLLIFTNGFLGSSHCVGMCGGFALALGTNSASVAVNGGRQVLYSLGRIFTYACGGAMAGFLGQLLLVSLPTIVRVQAVLAILAGILLIFQGLSAAGALPWWSRGTSGGSCLAPSLFAGLLRDTRRRSVFLAGVVNGLLPCGLVYAHLALAASAHDMLDGSAIMAVFGLGTIPIMVAVSCSGSFLGHALRSRILRVAAWCVVLTGIISIARGLGFLPEFNPTDMPACPMCGS